MLPPPVDLFLVSTVFAVFYTFFVLWGKQPKKVPDQTLKSFLKSGLN